MPVRIPVKVRAGAGQDSIDGWMGNVLKIRVAAPAEKGKANAAVERLLSKVLRVKIKIVSGLTSREKLLEVESLMPEEIRLRIENELRLKNP